MLSGFHPVVAEWFSKALGEPTDCQLKAWPAIRKRRHTLIAAPTGSGKTLAAFLCAIDELLRLGLEGRLTDETHVVYVSPLKALGNDIQKNLEAPLAGIRDRLLENGLDDVDIRTFVRTGDTPAYSRQLMRRRPPHILVTTPESLYILLTSVSGREALAKARTVIVDEIHAVAGTKRGAHLSLSLERLAALAERPLVRIGLSATQRPIEEVARFLTGTQGAPTDRSHPHPGPLPQGSGEIIDSHGALPEGRGGKPEGRVAASVPPCTIVDLGHTRRRNLAVELPRSPLSAVMSGEVWGEVYDRLAELIREHRTTLIFVNTRRLAERVTRHLSERIGETQVAAHHGSLSREHRLAAEQRLKAGDLRAMVATSSLELGIDIGEVDLVCQLGSTRSIGTFLQRAGRAGHGVGRVPKARLFPLSRDELIECIALLEAICRGELDRLWIPEQPLDVLAQQIVAEVAMREWPEGELFDLVRRAWPYRDLGREEFTGVVRMLAEGIATRRGRGSSRLHRDAVQGRLRARRGARLTAVTCGGAIPDNADYEVRKEPEGTFVGTVNEDFAIESIAGDIFQLGNASLRILKVDAGTVRVEDAHGLPPTIPFWLGEAPSRSHELSFAVSRLRAGFERQLGQAEAADRNGRDLAMHWFIESLGVPETAAGQAVEYLIAARAALGCLPTQDTLVVERFFDEAGGMQLVIHAPFGSRLNRAWGLALRKSFCRRFNFELQAAATEDAIVLSLGETHSFPLAEVWNFLKAASVREVLTQALLDAPMFTVRWRWNANVALAVPRFRGGRKVPPRLQRMQAEDLAAVVFPDSLACFENISGGRREVPDHPLVNQAIRDCLTEAMDIDALEALLREIESGRRRLIARDLTEPSPLAIEILNARPYAFLDDAPLEERRTQAVMSRRWLDPATASDLGRLDAGAIERLRQEVWPEAGNADELHDALLWLVCLSEAEIERAADRWRGLIEELRQQGRATRLQVNGSTALWTAAERLPLVRAVYPQAPPGPDISVPAEFATQTWAPEAALVELLRGRLQGLGPVTAMQLASTLALPVGGTEQALAALEAEGFVLRGRFTAAASDEEWCERRLLARIHRYTINRLRAEIAPVPAASYMRFLLRWHRLTADTHLHGEQAAEAVLAQLEGFPAPAQAWEQELLPARVAGYTGDMIDRLCLSGRWQWVRLSAAESGQAPVKTAPVALVARRQLNLWRSLVQPDKDTPAGALSTSAQKVAEFLGQHGPSFVDDVMDGTALLKSQVEDALAELVVRGRLTSDSFDGLRRLLKQSQRPPARRRPPARLDHSGRWVLLGAGAAVAEETAIEYLSRALLRRYGVVCRRTLDREPGLPPWRLLLMCCRRLEARGEVRGGRFIDGFAGEQFAMPEAVEALRGTHRTPAAGELVAVSAADPVNLTGIVTPGARMPALTGNRILYRDGVPVALLRAGEVSYCAPIEDAERWQLHNVLVRRAVSATSQG